MDNVLIVNLPSPPGMDVYRDTAGAYGTALYVRRRCYGHSSNVFFPTYVPYLATHLLRAGHRVQVIDAQADRLSVSSLIERIEQLDPICMITMLSLPSLYGDCQAINQIKCRLPRMPVIGLGPVCWLLAKEIMLESNADLLIRGQYPFYHGPILEFLQRFQIRTLSQAKQAAGGIIIEDRAGHVTVDLPSWPDCAGPLDDIDLETYHLLPIRKYRIAAMGPAGSLTSLFPIIGGKGCPFCCAYCPYPVGYGKRLVLKSPAMIVKEMQFLKEEYGVNGYLFRDQLFTQDSARVMAICDGIISSGLQVNWAVEARVDEVSRLLLSRMRQAGCIRIAYGVESGDPGLLYKVAKPGLCRDVIDRAFSDTVDEGIFAVAFVLLGLPAEDMASARRSIDYIWRLNCDNVLCSVATPYPGTGLFDQARDRGLIVCYDWSRYTGREVVMRTEHLTADQVDGLRSHMMRLFRLKQACKALRQRPAGSEGGYHGGPWAIGYIWPRSTSLAGAVEL